MQDSTFSASGERPRLPWWRWLIEGLRSGFFLAPRIGEAKPTPVQVGLLFVAVSALNTGLERLTIDGPAEFVWRSEFTSLWHNLFFLWFAWLMLHADGKACAKRGRQAAQRGLGAFFALSLWTGMPASLIIFAQSIAWTRGWLSALPLSGEWLGYLMWGAYLFACLWITAAMARLAARYVVSGWRLAGFVVALIALYILAAWQIQEKRWEPDYSANIEEDEKKPAYLTLTQSVFERQQAVAREALSGLLPERPGVIDVYGLVFAPYAGEEVFRRESTMVTEVIEQRFDAAGRVLNLLNHAETSERLPWATPENLKRAIEAIALRMDRDNDLLMVYLTSHGAKDFKLSARHWPLTVAPVTPEMLRAALDEAHIRNRVLIISACYSGGWIEPLANETTLVMTAADAEHTSYGCGSRSELTFFGRALFDEALRRTHSLTGAFAEARVEVERRETEAGKDDGFSNPQIRVGEGILPVLEALEKHLDGAP